MSYFDFTPYGPGLSPADISQVSNDNFYRIQRSITNITDSGGWIADTLPNVSTVTYNGNRSYDLTFTGDISKTLSPGMRLKTVRTVVAPTQCTSLNGTTQYYSKTSPTGLTFTTTFTASAWVKLNSYGVLSGIIARRNSDTEGWSFTIREDGRVQLIGLRIAGNNKQVNSYQSIPLNKWVHVAATLDMAAGDTSAQKIWIDGVEVPRAYTLTGTATALVQGTTALVVGATYSTGANPFPGKIAQAAVFSSQLSDATVKSYYSQGLSGTETNLVSAYSFNGTANDLNTTNANNLTAQGSATTTNADSPFSVNGSGAATGTDDYAIVQKVTSTVATVQVPVGCTIPTSGGISATYVSTQQAPFNFPMDKYLWEVVFIGKVQSNTGSVASSTTITNFTGYRLTVPVGYGELSFNGYGQITIAVAAAYLSQYLGLSTANNTFSDADLLGRGASISAALGEMDSSISKSKFIYNSSATIYYLNSRGSLNSTTQYVDGVTFPTIIKFLPSGL